MAEETCMKDVSNDEDISLSNLEILTFVKIKHVYFEISSLVLTVGLPNLSQEPVSEWLKRNDNPLDLIYRTNQSEYESSCKSGNVIVKNKAN